MIVLTIYSSLSFCSPGRVALAVASKSGQVITRVVDTGLGNDRERNMVAFAEHALYLLRDVLTAAERADQVEGDDPSKL